MATYQSNFAIGKSAPLIAHGAETVTQRAVLPLNVALAANDIIELAVLPADHVLTDVWLDSDDLDTGTSLLRFDGGLMSGTPGDATSVRTVGQQIFAANAFGSAPGVTRWSSSAGAQNLTAIFATQADRSLGLKVTAAANAFAPDATVVKSGGLWQPNTAYSATAGNIDVVTLPDGRRARCSTAGTSGTTFPFIGTEVKGGTVTDGSVTWTIMDAYVAMTIEYRAARNGI